MHEKSILFPLLPVQLLHTNYNTQRSVNYKKQHENFSIENQSKKQKKIGMEVLCLAAEHPVLARWAAVVTLTLL